MKFAIELSNKGPYQRVVEGELKNEELVAIVGDTIFWGGESYIVKSRIIDYDEETVVIKAAR